MEVTVMDAWCALLVVHVVAAHISVLEGSDSGSGSATSSTVAYGRLNQRTHDLVDRLCYVQG